MEKQPCHVYMAQAKNTTTTSPEWVREIDLLKTFGLSHMIVYGLRKAGKIESISLRIEGKKHGARIYNVKSVRKFLADQAKLESEVAK